MLLSQCLFTVIEHWLIRKDIKRSISIYLSNSESDTVAPHERPKILDLWFCIWYYFWKYLHKASWHSLFLKINSHFLKVLSFIPMPDITLPTCKIHVTNKYFLSEMCITKSPILGRYQISEVFKLDFLPRYICFYLIICTDLIPFIFIST